MGSSENSSTDARKKGVIMKRIGGFYYVKAADDLIECKPRGIFRKRGITPLPGDIAVLENEGGTWTITDIEPRKNSFMRPPVANVDLMVVVVSTVVPDADYMMTDKLLCIAEKAGVDAVIAYTKTDIADMGDFPYVYRKAGYEVIVTGDPGAGKRLRELIQGRVAVFVGNTGAGKSTLLNTIEPELNLATGETSRKLGRGRHTTRAVELYEIGGGLAADTPGFSALDFSSAVTSREVAGLYREFRPFLGSCRFSDCRHAGEEGCAVMKAVEDGIIGKTRYESYLGLLGQLEKSEKEELHR
ncbi:MAG: ribosome small subunit-dependent GTPase A [Oscillospiraceae bacterium]|jgi:ribosome biogenesis GTPase